jgi:hypothetical protein
LGSAFAPPSAAATSLSRFFTGGIEEVVGSAASVLTASSEDASGVGMGELSFSGLIMFVLRFGGECGCIPAGSFVPFG